ncbi:MAG TPA: class I SAM-dependent methyltransferase, partial [Chitinophagaceae bacterium]
EALRKRLRTDRRVITIDDYGAGGGGNKNKRSVSSIARRSLKPKKYASLVARIAGYLRPQRVIELGTSLGVTTAYIARACPEASIETLEGSPEIAAIAGDHFAALGINNIRVVTGSFDNTLPAILCNTTTVNFAFVDGNHRKAPTLTYFHWLAERCLPESVLVFDDIHWSREMEAAWREITRHPAVTCSIDLFFLGIVFFRKEFREPQHFIIRY